MIISNSIKQLVPDFYYSQDPSEISENKLYYFFPNYYSINNLKYYHNLYKDGRGKNGIEHETGSDKHAHFREILETTNAQSLLEIGFNRGTSAIVWLMSGLKYLHSIDHLDCPGAVEFIKKRFPNRFNFTLINSRLLEHNTFDRFFDLIFVDGEHNKDAVVNDFLRGLYFHPKYFLFDDTHDPSIRDGIDIFNRKLIFVKEYNKPFPMQLYKVNPKKVRIERLGFDL